MLSDRMKRWAAKLEERVAVLHRNATRGALLLPSFRPFVLDELAAVRKHMATATAPGLDGLPYPAWLADSPAASTQLLQLLSLMLRVGVIPPEFREGCIVPIPKPGVATCFDNWRPITLLTSISKIFEALLLGRLSPLIQRTLSPTQAGFRWGSDEHAWTLLSILDYMRHMPRLRRGPKHFHVAFIDIRKAYDTVWRAGLLHKLEQVTGVLPEWLAVANLLSNTTKCHTCWVLLCLTRCHRMSSQITSSMPMTLCS